ncbi:hypothetical protein GCM10023333_06190 [Ferrimonas pelagia]|uniref:Uncharacterized protein n=1 Tax=Ferrimonas pelagia TaxID=1177826 RepID=A0ABP9EEL2_9GAMM
MITSVYPVSNGDVYLGAPKSSGNLNCELVEGAYLTLERGHSNFTQTYSLILTAISTEKRMNIRIVPGSTDCRISYVMMSID